jgi:tetratricopeptide (TPR) repeat protein
VSGAVSVRMSPRGGGETAARRAQTESARTDYGLALRMAEVHRAADQQGLVLQRLAALALQTGDARAARVHLERALAIDRAEQRPIERARVALALGDVALVQGERRAAQTAYAQALEVFEPTDAVAERIATLSRLQRLLADSDPVLAQEYAGRADAPRAGTRAPAGDG